MNIVGNSMKNNLQVYNASMPQQQHTIEMAQNIYKAPLKPKHGSMKYKLDTDHDKQGGKLH